MLKAYLQKYESIFSPQEQALVNKYFPIKTLIALVEVDSTPLAKAPPLLIGSFLRSRSFINLIIEDELAKPFQTMTLFLPKAVSKNVLEKTLFMYRSAWFFIDSYAPFLNTTLAKETLTLLVLALGEIRTKNLFTSVFENYTHPDCYQFIETCAKEIAQLTLAKAGGSNYSLHELRQCIYAVFENHFDAKFPTPKLNNRPLE